MVVATLIGGTWAAVAADKQNEWPTVQEQQAAALAMDIASYAKGHDVSAEEAAARLADREAVDAVLGTLRTEHGDEFADAYFTHDKGFTVHILQVVGHEGATLELPATKTLNVVYETAPRSWNQLYALHKVVEGLAVKGEIKLSAQGINLDSLLTGKIWVTVKDEASAETVRKVGGDAVNVMISDIEPQAITASCPDRFDCRPVQGGIAIDR